MIAERLATRDGRIAVIQGGDLLILSRHRLNLPGKQIRSALATRR